jgi:hypothetical protein
MPANKGCHSMASAIHGSSAGNVMTVSKPAIG